MTDGTLVDIVGYHLYTSLTSGTYPPTGYTVPLSVLPDPNAPTYTTVCTQGYYWVVTAFTNENEGARSNEVTIPSVLEAALHFRLQRVINP